MPRLPMLFATAAIVALLLGLLTSRFDLLAGMTITLPKAQLEPAVLNVSQSYVYAEQQGLFNRIGNFFSGNPNSQQQVYILAQQKITTAARQSPLVPEAEKNTQAMLTGMLTSLGFKHIIVTFGPQAPAPTPTASPSH